MARRGGGRTRGRIGRLLARRWLPRPAVGDDPMLWKETHGTPGSRLLALVSLPGRDDGRRDGVRFAQGLDAAFLAKPVENGYRIAESDPRRALNAELSQASTEQPNALGPLADAVNAATSISREREDDTWISLISTPLPGREILPRQTHRRRSGRAGTSAMRSSGSSPSAP